VLLVQGQCVGNSAPGGLDERGQDPLEYHVRSCLRRVYEKWLGYGSGYQSQDIADGCDTC